MAPPADWNLDMVRAREARRLLPKDPASGMIAWGGIKAAQLDTGYTEHPVFGFREDDAPWLLTADGLNQREPGSLPVDPLNYEGNPGHGTRTCSLLCGEAVALAGGPAVPSEIGIATRLPVIPCRVVDSVVLSPERNREAVASGIKHAIRKGCQVVSISLGTPFFLPGTTGGMGRAVDKAYQEGIIVVAAGGQIIDSVTYPGKYDRTIGVGGVTSARRIWFDYNAGRDRIDVWAPAADVNRADSLAQPGQPTMPPIEGDDPGGSSSLSPGSHSGSYGKGAGTSYATAHVAGAAAMWLLARGSDIERRYDEPWQRVEAFRRLLRKTAKPIVGVQPGNGTGILDIEALLLAELPDPANLIKAPKDENKFA